MNSIIAISMIVIVVIIVIIIIVCLTTIIIIRLARSSVPFVTVLLTLRAPPPISLNIRQLVFLTCSSSSLLTSVGFSASSGCEEDGRSDRGTEQQFGVQGCGV